MIKIFKGGDIKFPVNSVAGLGTKYKIYFYTKRPDVNVSKTDLDVVEATEPYIPLPWSDLAMIGEGVMNLTVNNMTPDMSYDDGVYDNTFTRTTNYYIVNEGGDVPGSLEERVEALETGLAEEVERSVTYDDNMTMLFNTLSDDLEQEEAVREAADTALQTNLNTVNDGLNETIIQLTNEITNRQQADNQLSQDITSEAQQRQLADGNLQTAIDANASAISNIEDELELYALKSDVYNKTQIDSKVSDINTSIGSEESSRIAGDDNLQTQINQKANSADVYTKTAVDTLLGNKADASTTYTKTEVDTALGAKANSADVYGKNEVYTKAETDAAINAHTPDLSNYYTKSQTDTLLNGKADKATTLAGYGITDAYTKTETDTLLSAKADTATTLSGYGITDAYTKTEVDTALSAKADSSTVYTKSEVDTALAGKASTATTLAGYGITDAYTKTETDTAISTAVGTETTARQNADSALDLRVTALENAPAPTPYDDTQIRQIIEDNELVTASAISDLQDADAVLAGANASMNARVTALENAPAPTPDLSNYYTKSEVDTALAGKADASTTYSKTEVDTALSAKANQSTTYTKTETDTAISTALGSYYTKSQIDDNELVTARALTALDTNKADKATTYTKSEVDTALSGKASTATTIAGYGITDAYTKTEIDATVGDINTILQSI